MTLREIREYVAINWKLLVALAAVAAIVAALLATGELKFGSGGSDQNHSSNYTGTAKMSYDLGYSCAQDAWRVAGNDPQASANPMGTFDAMSAGCARLAMAARISNAPSSPFHKGFADGFAQGPPQP
jgi:hypothetical protein